MSKRHYNYKGRTTKMSKSQRKRDAFNYRYAYFQKNPGLFGFIWFCSQCGMPLLGKDNVQVDHIIPLAGVGINRTINTVAICPRCNREKSDKGGKYIVKGSIAKVIEVLLFTIQKLLLLGLVGILKVLHFLCKAIVSIVKALALALGPAVYVAIMLVILVLLLL